MVISAVSRVIRRESAGASSREAGSFQRTPRRDVFRMHRHDQLRRRRPVQPQLPHERDDHARAQAAPGVLRFTDQIVDAAAAHRHFHQRFQLGDVLRIVMQPQPLCQPDRPPVAPRDEHFGRLDAVDAVAVVRLEPGGRRIVVPPARHMRLHQPVREQREVGARQGAEGEVGHRMWSLP
jgi:hypothetical protein